MYVYGQHCFLKPPRIAGLRMVPFTLGHAAVLCGLGSPVLSGKGLEQDDLAVALFVCSRDSSKARKQIQNGRAKRTIRALGGLFLSRDDAVLRGFYSDFSEYLSVYSMAPPRWEKEGCGKSPAVPWHLSIFAALQKETNLSAGELWAMALPEALELFAAVAANAGDESLVTLAELPIFEKLKADEVGL